MKSKTITVIVMLFYSLLLTVAGCMAQSPMQQPLGYLELQAEIVKDNNAESCQVIIYNYETEQEIVDKTKGSYKCRLKLNHTYCVSFKKEGFITKSIVINTDCNKSGYYLFEFIVSLEPVVNYKYSLVADIFYDSKKQDFDYEMLNIQN